MVAFALFGLPILAYFVGLPESTSAATSASEELTSSVAASAVESISKPTFQLPSYPTPPPYKESSAVEPEVGGINVREAISRINLNRDQNFDYENDNEFRSDSESESELEFEVETKPPLPARPHPTLRTKFASIKNYSGSLLHSSDNFQTIEYDDGDEEGTDL